MEKSCEGSYGILIKKKGSKLGLLPFLPILLVIKIHFSISVGIVFIIKTNIVVTKVVEFRCYIKYFSLLLNNRVFYIFRRNKRSPAVICQAPKSKELEILNRKSSKKGNTKETQ